MTRPRTRANGEGSIFPYKTGFAAYAWVTKPDGLRQRKYVYGPTREVVHEKWVALQRQARRGPVVTKVPTLREFLEGWHRDVVVPNLAPTTVTNYRLFIDRYIAPTLGSVRLDRLGVRDVQTWLNDTRRRCQCCAQGKDAGRPVPRCCAIGRCCSQTASDWTVRQAWTVLRSALSSAMREELVARNVAALVRVPVPRPEKPSPWSVDEARAFLRRTSEAGDELHEAYVLLLLLGLRRGELLGLRWSDVDEESATLRVSRQLQRAEGGLVLRATKTSASTAPVPLPAVCTAALATIRDRQGRQRESAGDAWHDHGLVIATRFGMPVDPRNFHRAFKASARAAGVREVPVHATRRTCASLLVALDVHPRVAMQILRHSQIAVTMNVYAEVTSASSRQALGRLDEALSW